MTQSKALKHVVNNSGEPINPFGILFLLVQNKDLFKVKEMLINEKFVGNQSLLFDALKPGNYTMFGVNNTLWVDWNEVYLTTSDGIGGVSCDFGKTPTSERLHKQMNMY